MGNWECRGKSSRPVTSFFAVLKITNKKVCEHQQAEKLKKSSKPEIRYQIFSKVIRCCIIEIQRYKVLYCSSLTWGTHRLCSEISDQILMVHHIFFLSSMSV